MDAGYYMKKTMIMTRERSEEEKLRRHLHGDKGAKFSAGKIPKLAPPRCDRYDNHDDNKGYLACRDI